MAKIPDNRLILTYDADKNLTDTSKHLTKSLLPQIISYMSANFDDIPEVYRKTLFSATVVGQPSRDQYLPEQYLGKSAPVWTEIALRYAAGYLDHVAAGKDAFTAEKLAWDFENSNGPLRQKLEELLEEKGKKNN